MLVRDPIYHQLHQLLHELIQKREYQPGHKFLTEREIAERFGVSRTTANKALSSLVADGTLEFRKGVGTFVLPCALRLDLRSLVSFSDKALSMGRTPGTQVIEFHSLNGMDAPASVSSLLEVDSDDRLFFVQRLRFADGTPVILERRYVVAGLCPRLCQRDLEGSLYSAWTTKHRLVITGADQSIRATNLPEEDAHLLGVEQSAAALVVTAVGCIEGNKPLWWEETLYRADAYEFHCKLGGLHSPSSPIGQLRAKP